MLSSLKKFCRRPRLDILWLATCGWALAGSALAAGQDHPLLSGMPAYEVDAREVLDHGTYPDQSVFICGPSRKCSASDPGFSTEGKLVVEGKVTRLRYANKGPGQTLAVTRNYETAIRTAGGRKLTWQEGYEGEQVFLVEQGGRRIWVVLEKFYNSSFKLT